MGGLIPFKTEDSCFQFVDGRTESIGLINMDGRNIQARFIIRGGKINASFPVENSRSGFSIPAVDEPLQGYSVIFRLANQDEDSGFRFQPVQMRLSYAVL
jgi:hypothetical protein